MFEYVELSDGTIKITGFAEGVSEKDLIIPDKIDGKIVTIIENWSFFRSDLTSVIIPSSITNIGKCVFMNNNQLTSVTLNEGLINIGASAFENTCLTNIEIPSSVISIRNHAFMYNNLESVVLKEGLVNISHYAFGYNNLTSITIPSSVKSIEKLTFIDNKNLTEIRYNNKIYKVKYADGFIMEILSSKKLDDILVYKCKHFLEEEVTYCAEKDEVFAHGENIKEAIEDLKYKFMERENIEEHVKRIKGQGYVTINDYRLVTGACRQGVQRFKEELELEGYRLSIEDTLKLTEGRHGHEKFKELMEY